MSRSTLRRGLSTTACLSTVLLSPGTWLHAQGSGIVGNWKTPGGSVVRVAPCGPDVCATLASIEPGAPSTVDGKNPEPGLRTRKLCGLQIGYGFQPSGPDHAEGGHLYDPKTGKTYRGEMTSEGDHLDLRGYVGVKAFGRTERWTRTSALPPSCS